MPAPILISGLAAARVVAGIVGRGSRNVNPVYRNTPKSNVKLVPNTATEAKEFSKFIGEKVSPKQYQQIQNKAATKMAKDTKSGAIAKAMAKAAEKRAK